MLESCRDKRKVAAFEEAAGLVTFEVAEEAGASSVVRGVSEILPFGSQAACGGVMVAVGAATFLSLGMAELKSAGVEELLVEEVVAPLLAVGAGNLEQIFPPAWGGCPLVQ